MLVAVCLVLMNQTSFERRNITIIEKLVRDIYTPLQSGVGEFRGYSGLIQGLLADKDDLIRENRLLKQRIKRYQIANQRYLDYKEQNQRYRELLNFKEVNQESMTLITAEVIARSPNTWYKTIMINKGIDQGIVRNMSVITPDGLVGKITTVSRNASEVLLITDREGAVGAIDSETRTPGIIEGFGNSNLLRLNQIPYYSAIKPGDQIKTSMLSEIYPAGLLVGRVKTVSKQTSGLLKTAVIEPAVDFDKLEEVFVIKDMVQLPPQNANQNTSSE